MKKMVEASFASKIKFASFLSTDLSFHLESWNPVWPDGRHPFLGCKEEFVIVSK